MIRPLRNGLLAVIAAGSLLPDVQAEALLLEDPGPHREALLAYLGGSLAAVVESPDRLSAAVRLDRSPFLADGGRRALDLDALPGTTADDLRRAATKAGGATRLLFDTLKDRAMAHYPRSRQLPDDLGAILQERSVLADPRWRSVDLDSLIARGARRIRFSLEEVLAPLAGDGDRPRYAPGTLLVAEELDAQGRVHETHVMRKRVDHEWDFALYDEQGQRRELGRNGPAFRAPVTCFTCHQATGRVAPFSDFPGPSRAIREFTPAVRFPLDPAETLLFRQGALAEPEGDQLHGKYRGLALVELQRITRDPAAPAWAHDLRDRLVRRIPALR